MLPIIKNLGSDGSFMKCDTNIIFIRSVFGAFIDFFWTYEGKNGCVYER